MISQPLVSIIIPTYNRANLIGETLDSVLAQTYTHWECIIVDDGSSDNTDEVVREYLKKDPRFTYFHRPDTHKPGGNGARNYGFLQSKGEYIQWFDSDDLMHPEKLERQVDVLFEKPLAVAFCMWGKFVNTPEDANINLKPYYQNYQDPYMLLEDIGKYGSYIPCHAYLVDRKIISSSGVWNESLKINQDGEFFCRVLLNCENVFFAKDVFVYYRNQAATNTSQNNSSRRLEERIRSWKLIESYILRHTGIKNSLYVQRAKKSIFRSLKKRKSSLQFKYYFFFWQQQLPYKILTKIIGK